MEISIIKQFLIIIFCILPIVAFAQGTDNTHISGSIYGLEMQSGKLDTIPLFAANVFWMNTTTGVITDNNGYFRILKPKLNDKKLVVNYVGYENDTVNVRIKQKFLNIYLKKLRSLEDVIVQAEKPHTVQLQNSAMNTKTITESGLRTCACCNLAESFVNTAAIDIEETDAVSGAKRIKMLGLAGFYTQILVEKKPVMRGLISPFGLEYIPGHWMESVDISKGAASVTTGYESITGQINVELKKPEDVKPLSFNAYQNSMGKSELALTLGRQINPQISTMLLGYGTYNRSKWDENSDTFTDMPLVSHINVMNRWKYDSENRYAQMGVKVIHDHRDGGQMGFDFSEDKISNSFYGSHNQIERFEFFAKGGFSFDDKKTHFGIVFSGFRHDQTSFWGVKNYSGDESSIYLNLIYVKNISNHKITSGLSYNYNDQNEKYLETDYNSSEKVPGIFTEYTYQLKDRLTAMAGFRYDEHNQFGSFYTPRFHIKYQFVNSTSARFSLGKGYRNPHVFMENPAILASSKELVFLQNLEAEEAWNAGFHVIHDFQLGENRPASLAFDLYRTDFQNQIVVDMEQDVQQVILYNLDGNSYSNSAQIEFESTLFKNLLTTAAYRFNDVKTTYQGKLKEVPLNNKHKVLLVFSYTTPNDNWQFDFTSQFNGKTRFPGSNTNPYRQHSNRFSPAYALLFGQIKRKFDNWEIYAGVENITNYRQSNPILAWSEPFSPYFDSSSIWGPTVGRRIYLGIRVAK